MFYYGDRPSRLALSEGCGMVSGRELIAELSKYKGVKYYTYLKQVCQKYKKSQKSRIRRKNAFLI